MSIFGKLFNGAKNKINVKQLVNGVTAQMKVGVGTQQGGNSGIFGGLFGNKAAKNQQADILAGSVQQAGKVPPAASQGGGIKKIIIGVLAAAVLYLLFIKKK